MRISSIKKLVPDSLISAVCNALPLSCGGILMFHRVGQINRDGIQCNEHLKVSPEFLDQTLHTFRKHGFSFISLDELADLLSKHKRFSKVIALTFDDGYKDNLTNGLPVLEQYNAPGMIYVATGLMTGETVPWWDFLEESLLEKSESVEFEGISYHCRTMKEKEDAYLSIRERIMFDSSAKILHRLRSAGILPDNRTAADYRSEMVTEVDLQQYSGHRLISFGSHTHSHLCCGKLSEENFESELYKSIQILRSSGIEVRHFAYPYGDDVSPRQDFTGILQQHKIGSAVTTYGGLFRPDSDPWFLPRIFVSEYTNHPVYKDYLWLKRNIFSAELRNRWFWKKAEREDRN